MSFVTLGVVSNCWTDLLRTGTLEEQCRRAVEVGYGYVELRQRGLGDCEERISGDDRPWPLPERLAALRRALPELGMNLAVEAPFLTREVPHDAYLDRCVEAALALGTPATLRLVDLSPVSGIPDAAAAAELARGVAALGAYLWKRGVGLALENSKQPVAVLRQVIRQSRAAGHAAGGHRELDAEVDERHAGGLSAADTPRICWDPANQLVQKLQVEDPVAMARDFAPGELFEFHFKQLRGGEVQGDVDAGEIDWHALSGALREAGYRGPALFEIPPGPDIWDRLERSTAYIRGVLGES